MATQCSHRPIRALLLLVAARNTAANFVSYGCQIEVIAHGILRKP